MADVDVDVGATAQARGDVVNGVIHVLVDASLQAEGADDARVVVLLSGVDELLTQLERGFEQGFTDRGGVVAHDGHLRDLLVSGHGHLLGSRQANVAVKGGLEAPVDAEQLERLVTVGQRAVEEVQVEHGTDDVALDASAVEAFLIDDALFEQGLRLLDVFFVGCAREETTFELLLGVMQLDDDQAVDVLRVIDFLRVRQACLVEDPVVILVLGPLFHAQHVARAKHGDVEVVLDGVDVAVGGERAVRDVHHVAVAHALLHGGVEHAVKGGHHDGLVHHAASDATGGVALAAEVLRVGLLAPLFAIRHGGEAFLDRAVTNVQRRVGCGHAHAELHAVVVLDDACDVVTGDHALASFGPPRGGFSVIPLQLHQLVGRERLARHQFAHEVGDLHAWCWTVALAAFRTAHGPEHVLDGVEASKGDDVVVVGAVGLSLDGAEFTVRALLLGAGFVHLSMPLEHEIVGGLGRGSGFLDLLVGRFLLFLSLLQIRTDRAKLGVVGFGSFHVTDLLLDALHALHDLLLVLAGVAALLKLTLEAVKVSA